VGRTSTGTIRKLPSGRYQVRYWCIDGQRRTARQSFATKRDANLWLASAVLDTAAGRWTDQRTYNTTLTEYSEAWLGDRVGLARRTQEIYGEQLRLHILPSIDSDIPALGSVALIDISPLLVRAWYGALQESRGHSVAAKAYVRLRQILRHAVDDDLMAKNPCRIERGGVEHHPEQRFLCMAELYDLASAVPERYRVFVLLAGLGGLRQGELAALRRSDLDSVTGCLTVRRKRLRLASGEIVEEQPKSAAGRRMVALPTPLVADLLDHLESYTDGSDNGYMFTTDGGGPVDRNNFRNRVWLPATAQVGLSGLRFHDLRHTAGTLAAQTGATTKELMARLGHASPQAAMVYQHAADDRDRLIADRLTEMAVLAGIPNAERAADDRSGRS
jgi:integrase